MTPVMQEFDHDPPKSYGDCHRAAIASLLDLPLADVPHFAAGLPDGDPQFWERQDIWLRARGLALISIPILGENVSKVCLAAIAWNPGHPEFLLGGTSKLGCGHTVVADKSGIIHDPSKAQSGIVGPMNDGCYWVTYIVGAR